MVLFQYNIILNMTKHHKVYTTPEEDMMLDELKRAYDKKSTSGMFRKILRIFYNLKNNE